MSRGRSPIDLYLHRLSTRLWLTAPFRRRTILREVEDHLREAHRLRADASDGVESERQAVERFGRYPVRRSIPAAVVIGALGVAAAVLWMARSPNSAQARVVRASVTYRGYPSNDGFWPVVASVHPNQYQLPLSVVRRELPTGRIPPKPLPGSCGPRHIVVSLVWSDGSHKSYALCTAPESIHRVRDKLYTTYNRSAALRRYLRAQYVRAVRRLQPLPRTAVPRPHQITVTGGTRGERRLLRTVIARMPAAGIAASQIQIQDTPWRVIHLTLSSPPMPTAARSAYNTRAAWALATNRWAAVELVAAFNRLAPNRGIKPLANALAPYAPAIPANRYAKVTPSDKPLDWFVLKGMARQAHVRLVDATYGPLGYGELIRFQIADPHDAEQAMNKLHVPRNAPFPAELQLENPCGTPIAVLQSFPGLTGNWMDVAWIASEGDLAPMFNAGPAYPSTPCG